jgi:hypothetical protein
MDKYAAALHLQWVRGTHNETHPKSMTGYILALRMQIEHKEAKDEAYASVDKVRYD